MTLNDLIDELEYLRESGISGDTAVRFASQPSWPFEYSISSIAALTKDSWEESLRGEMEGEGMSEEEIAEGIANAELDKVESVVYLVEGHQIGYLSGEAKDTIGW